MPELPEVRTVAALLSKNLAHKKITDLSIYREKNILVPKEEFCAFLKGETFLNVTGYGKYLLFHLTNHKVMLSHLRMEGKYQIRSLKEEKEKHDICAFYLDSGETLVYMDVRKFGQITIRREEDAFSLPPLSCLGKEIWDISAKELYQLLKRCKKPIKEAIMDQHIIAGIGNIYADETLFAAKIHPLQKASSLSEEEVSLLKEKASSILSKAIEEGGSTIRSYHPEKNMDGRFQVSLQVYGKEGELCPRCSSPLRHILVGGRGTTYCPICQKRKERGILIGITGEIATGKSATLSYFKENGFQTLSSDEVVHQLYEEKEIIKWMRENVSFSLIHKGKIDRKKLLSLFLKDKRILEKVEEKIHPLVYQKIRTFLSECCENVNIAIEVPLLFNSPIEKECDYLLFVYAEEETRKQRLLARGKDPVKSMALSPSFSMSEVKKRCAFLIDGSSSLSYLEEQIDKVLSLIRKR